jgi:hypothetical protein
MLAEVAAIDLNPTPDGLQDPPTWPDGLFPRGFSCPPHLPFFDLRQCRESFCARRELFHHRHRVRPLPNGGGAAWPCSLHVGFGLTTRKNAEGGRR